MTEGDREPDELVLTEDEADWLAQYLESREVCSPPPFEAIRKLASSAITNAPDFVLIDHLRRRGWFIRPALATNAAEPKP